MTGEGKILNWKATLARYLQIRWLRLVFLAGAGFIVRMPSLQGQLIWDDQLLIRDNPFIKSPLLFIETFRHYLFPDGFSAHYRPVQNISFFFDYWLWNENTYGYHLTNILLHVGSGLILYFLLRRLLVALWKPERDGRTVPTLAAYLVAFLWMVHPVHSAAVDYISGRADSLAFLFASTGWLLALRAREVSYPPWRFLAYAGAALCGLLALCSREIACIWFALFLVHLFCLDKATGRRTKFVSLAICFLVLGVYVGLRQLPEPRSGPAPTSSWSAPMRAVLMLRALGDYGRLMLAPANLHMERNLIDSDNYRSGESWRHSVASEYLSIGGLIVLAALLFGSLRKGRAQPIRILGASWFGLGYLPISNLVELNATVAEHWLYLPSVGFLIFLAGCALELPPHYRRLSATLAGIAVVALGWRSTVRSTDWVSEEVFYTRTFACGGSSTRVAVNLGQIFTNHGDYAKAEAIFRNVLSITPDYPIGRTDLADVLYRQGKTKEAEAIYQATSSAAQSTRKEYPRTWIAALNLAHLRHNAKDDGGALVILEQTRREYPKVWEVISLESEVLRESQGPEAALHQVEKFASMNSWHYGAALALGKLYAEKGDVDRAESALRQASRLDVHDVNALNTIATIGLRQNRLEDAFAAQRRAVARQPDEPRQYVMLSNILEKMGRMEEARAAVAKVTQLKMLAAAPAIAQ